MEQRAFLDTGKFTPQPKPERRRRAGFSTELVLMLCAFALLGMAAGIMLVEADVRSRGLS